MSDSEDEGHPLEGILDIVQEGVERVNGILSELWGRLTAPVARTWETVRTPWELRMRGQQPLPSGTYRDPPSPSVTDRPPRGLRDTVERRRQRRRPRSARRLRLASPERQPVEPFVNSPSMFDGPGDDRDPTGELYIRSQSRRDELERQADVRREQMGRRQRKGRLANLRF